MLGIGVVGYGYWGPNIARNFAALDGCDAVVHLAGKNIAGGYRQDVELTLGQNRVVFMAHSVDRLPVAVVEPPAREAGVKVASVAELVDKLKNEAKVI